MSSVPFTDVLFSQHGHAGVIMLNRPQTINALTGPMVLAVSHQLRIWSEDPDIYVIILMGAGERGLCAGGDIRALYTSGKAGDGQAETFWRDEYALNDAIARYPKPYVALMDGLVMGGGIGLSAHARHRIVTERSKLAMPEVGIGFLPDVGGTWLLSHAPGETGTFLGLTGTAFGAADALYTGFADILVPSNQLQALIDKLADIASSDDVSALLQEAAVKTETSSLSLQRADIDKVFQGDDAESMIAAAKALGTDWGNTVANTLLERSPTSVKVTLAALRRARKLSSLSACLEMELRAGLQILRGHDFYEGVRAQIIDKDRNPKWQPATLTEIDAAAVAAHFDPA